MNNARTPESAVPIDLPIAERIAAAVRRYGESDVIERAVALMGGANVGEDFLLFVGGRHAQGLLDGAPPLYWPELWGARAPIHVWDKRATSAIVAGLGNEAWRVREMSAKVAAVRALALPEELAALLVDDVARVRAASVRALAEIGGMEQAVAVKALLNDPDIDVRRRANEALSKFQDRLGEPIG